MKTHCKNILVLLGLFLISFGTSEKEALAQEGNGISLETFKYSTSSESFFETTLPSVNEEFKWSFGGVAYYAQNPLRRETVLVESNQVLDVVDVVKYRLGVDLFGAVGLFGFAEAGLALPIIAFQSGEGVVPQENIQHVGFGDPRLELKARLARFSGVELGIGAIVTAPLGHYLSSGRDFMGSSGFTAEPRLLASFTKGPIVIALNSGVVFRPKETLVNYTQGNALTWNAAFAYDIRDFSEPGGMRLAFETNGETSFSFDSLIETPMEALFGLKYRTSKDNILAVGGGPGMSTAVGTPAFRVFASFSFDNLPKRCPAGAEDMDGFKDFDNCVDPDNDQDGILDEADKCPNDSEDTDNYQDEDGCPDKDNDNDGISDPVDGCPLIPEDKDNFEDDDGCPEEGPEKSTVKVTDTQILISSKIYFDFDKSTIKPVSYPILDAVAEAIIADSSLKKVRIDGHSDNEGNENYNIKLSEERAKAVMDYLISKKVQPGRLTFKGFGFSKPKASNRTEEGKAINRRVEFTIIERK